MTFTRLRYHILEKGKIQSIEIEEDSLKLFEKNSVTAKALGKEDITCVAFESVLGRPMLSIKSKKGTFVWRGDKDDLERAYRSILNFVGEDSVRRGHQKMSSLLGAVGGVMLFLGGGLRFFCDDKFRLSISTVLLFMGIVICIMALSEWYAGNKQKF